MGLSLFPSRFFFFYISSIQHDSSSPDIALIVWPHINRCVTFICIYTFFFVINFFLFVSWLQRPKASHSHTDIQTHKKSSSLFIQQPIIIPLSLNSNRTMLFCSISVFFFLLLLLFDNYSLNFYFIIFYYPNIIIARLYKVLYRPISHRATSHISNGMITL